MSDVTELPGPALELERVAAGYDHTVVLTVDALRLERGTVTALMGPNGSGKSTLLLLVAGLLRPRHGRVRVLGRPPDGRCIAALFQSSPSTADLPLTVEEVVRMGRYPHRGLARRFGKEDHEAVDEAVERVDVHGLRRRQLAELSGGQRQRVLLARALAQRAPVLLLDEPVAGLDGASQERIRDVLVAERERGVTVLVATHDPEGARDADRVLLLDGTIVVDGAPSQVLPEPGPHPLRSGAASA